MSVEYVNRSWLAKQGPLLLGCLITSGACARRDQNTRGVAGTSGVEGLGEVAAAPDVAPATGRDRFRQEPRLLPVSGGPWSLLRRHAESARLALGAQGTVFVSTRPEDKVYVLVDDDGDHKWTVCTW